MCRYADQVSLSQAEPPTLPTDGKTGRISWDSVTRSIRSWKGRVTLFQFMHSCLTSTHNVHCCVKGCVGQEVGVWLILYVTLILYYILSLGLFFSPQTSAKLLVHKIQSPREWEALQSLTVRVALLISPLCIAPNSQIMDVCTLFVFAGS